MKPEDAKRLHDDNDLRDAFQLLRERYNRDFENAVVDDKDGLQLIRMKFELIKDVYAELRKVLNNQTMS